MRTAEEARKYTLGIQEWKKRRLETRVGEVAKRLLEKADKQVEAAGIEGAFHATLFPHDILSCLTREEASSEECLVAVWSRLKEDLEGFGYRVPPFVCGGQVPFYWNQEVSDSIKRE